MVANEALGYASAGPATINPVPAYGWHYYAGFAQDDWRVNSRLTLSLGVRYDYESEVSERHNWMNAGFNLNVAQPFCLPNATGQPLPDAPLPPPRLRDPPAATLAD